MCKKEFDSVSKTTPFSWKIKCKFFTDNIEFLNRVVDGEFNNSKFKPDRYTHLVVIEVDDIEAFERVSNHELLLRRSKAPLVKVFSVDRVGEV